MAGYRPNPKTTSPGGVQPWHIRSLMTIDHHATVFAGLGAKLGCKFGMNVRPERWIYGIEGFAP